MKSRQNRWNGGIIGREDYLEGNNVISASQNYTRNVGCYQAEFNLPNFVRPTEWRNLPGMTQGNQIFAGLFAVYDNDSNFVAFTCRGAYQVDWGDGTSNTYADNTTAQKVYNRTTYSGLTSDVYQNYKNLVITITPQAGQNLTSINLNVRHSQANLQNYINQWLDIKVAGSLISSLTLGSDGTTSMMCVLLKEFEFVGTNQITNAGAMFGHCTTLERIKSLHTSSVTSMYRMHFNCFMLKEIPLYDTSNVTSFEECFYACGYLKKCPPLNTSKATNLFRMFYLARSLTEVPSFNTSSATTIRGMFDGCRSLKTVPWMDTRNVTNMQALFNNCLALRKIPYLNTSNVTDMGLMFSACVSLEEIPPLDFSKVTSLTYAFSYCYSLRKLPYLNTSTSLTNINYMAIDAFIIEEINFQNTTNVTVMEGAFTRTRSLRKLTGLNTAKVTNFTSPFTLCGLSECPILQFDEVVNGTQIFSTSEFKSFGNTFFNFPKATSLSLLFQNASVNECPPINAPNCLNVSSMFNGSGLISLRGLTIASGSTLASFNTTGFNSMFNNCGALTTIPTLNLDGLSAAAFTSIFTNMFAGCRSLASLNGLTGIGYNISVANAKLSATALNELYQGLSVVGASGSNVRTVTVTGNWGASAALGHLPSIAIEKGWQVTG